MTETGSPAPATGAGSEAPEQTAQVIDIATARREGAAEGTAQHQAYVEEVLDLCALADLPGMAAELIKAKRPVAECRKALQAARAARTASAAAIDPHRPPARPGGAAAASINPDTIYRARALAARAS